MQKTLKVLSLDGGGSRGILSARILKNIESYLNEKTRRNAPIGEYFDLIVGTSTGGLIALAAANYTKAPEIADFYEEHIPNIFGSKAMRNKASQAFWPKYTSKALRSAAEEFFGDRTLGEVNTHVCITSVSLQDARPLLFKSGYNDRYLTRLKEKQSDIAIATSAAPSYFSAHDTSTKIALIDGGICANNPAMIGLLETIQFDRTITPHAPENMANAITGGVLLLSIGTALTLRPPMISKILGTVAR